MTTRSFPEFITARRRELDLTLGDVANSLGVSPITVSNWSNGDSTPNVENLEALAALLEVAPDRLARMAGVSLEPSTGAAVNLMPPDEAATNQSKEAAAVDSVVPPPATESAAPDEAARVAEAEVVDDVPIPAAEPDLPASQEVAPAGSIDSELAEMIEEIEETAPALDDAPDSVPAFVSQPAPLPEPSAAAPARQRSVGRSRPSPAVPEREVITLPLTYIEDPRQLMRYRIRWVLTVVVLFVMFVILLWASRELISALAEVKESVTPGGIGGG